MPTFPPPCSSGVCAGCVPEGPGQTGKSSCSPCCHIYAPANQSEKKSRLLVLVKLQSLINVPNQFRFRAGGVADSVPDPYYFVGSGYTICLVETILPITLEYWKVTLHLLGTPTPVRYSKSTRNRCTATCEIHLQYYTLKVHLSLQGTVQCTPKDKIQLQHRDNCIIEIQPRLRGTTMYIYEVRYNYNYTPSRYIYNYHYINIYHVQLQLLTTLYKYDIKR